MVLPFLTCPLCVRCQAPGVRVCVGKSGVQKLNILLLYYFLPVSSCQVTKVSEQSCGCLRIRTGGEKKKICLYFCFVSMYRFDFVAVIIQYLFLQFICYGWCLRTSESIFPLQKIRLELYKLLLLLLLVLLLLLLVLLLLLLLILLLFA